MRGTPAPSPPRGRRSSGPGAAGPSSAKGPASAHGRAIAVAAGPSVDEVIALRHALRGLARSQRDAIELHYFRRLSAEEAGRRLGVPATTVRGRPQTRRAALRAQLGRDAPSHAASAANPVSLQAVLSAIRRRGLDGVHALRGQPAVLFCGVPADVNVLPSPDADLHVRGSAWAVGERALSAIALRHDAVDDDLATGPHAGASSPARAWTGAAPPPRRWRWPTGGPAPVRG